MDLTEYVKTGGCLATGKVGEIEVPTAIETVKAKG